MAGKGLALTERDRNVLAEVQRFGLVTREQLLRLGIFRSKTRANERLRKLTAAGLLVARPQALLAGGPRHIYLPGPQLQHSRGARKRMLEGSELFVAHQLGLMDIRLAFERHVQVRRHLSDHELSDMALGIVPDGYIEYTTAGLDFCAFVEYDRGTETLGTIERKARAYLDLAMSGRFGRQFQRRYFRTVFVTDTVGRLNTLSTAVARVTDRVMRLTTLPELVNSGPSAPIWRRPGSHVSESLTT